jgi:hypothetical protein
MFTLLDRQARQLASNVAEVEASLVARGLIAIASASARHEATGCEEKKTTDRTDERFAHRCHVHMGRLSEMGGLPSDVIRIRGAGSNASAIY